MFKDPRWQKKRLEILERDGWTCCRCGDASKTLHVHHTCYFSIVESGSGNRVRFPWEYNGKQLVTLCENCHESEHEHLERASVNLISVLKVSGFLVEDFFDLFEEVIAGKITPKRFRKRLPVDSPNNG
jgi:hypothetical protein